MNNGSESSEDFMSLERSFQQDLKIDVSKSSSADDALDLVSNCFCSVFN